MSYQTPWLCVNSECNHVLGYVNGGEFTPADDIIPSEISTRGANLIVKCPKCGTIKTWYTSDPLVRTLNQLIEIISEQMAKRAIHSIHIQTK